MTKAAKEKLACLKRQRRILNGTTHSMLFDLLMILVEELIKRESR